MTKIVIPEELTVAVSEAKRLRAERDAVMEELTKVREVNAEQAKRIGELREQLRQAQQRITTLSERKWPQVARSD